MKKITINQSGQDEEGIEYDPKTDCFSASGELTSHTPLRISNEITYSAYYFSTTLDEIVTPASPLALTAGTLAGDVITLRFVGTVTLFYSIEVAMQYVSGAITYDLDFYAGHLYVND